MKKIRIFTFLFLMFLSTNVCASVKTFDRTSENNFGVNKNISINSSNKSNILNTPMVDAEEKIYDFADILSDEEEDEIYKYINEFINKTNMDMVFVSVDMSYTNDIKNEEFAADFYDYNDFGIDLEHYSGVLLLRNDYENDRYYNIYTFGDAQLYFSFNRLENILDLIYSDFVNKNYEDGIMTFINECDKYYDKGIAHEYKNAYIDELGFIKYNYVVPVIPCLLISLLITLIVMVILVKKNKMVRKAINADEYLDKGSINYSVKNDNFITSKTTSYTMSSSSGGSRGGSSGRGHSCGGGRHG